MPIFFVELQYTIITLLSSALALECSYCTLMLSVVGLLIFILVSECLALVLFFMRLCFLPGLQITKLYIIYLHFLLFLFFLHPLIPTDIRSQSAQPYPFFFFSIFFFVQTLWITRSFRYFFGIFYSFLCL